MLDVLAKESSCAVISVWTDEGIAEGLEKELQKKKVLETPYEFILAHNFLFSPAFSLLTPTGLYLT